MKGEENTTDLTIFSMAESPRKGDIKWFVLERLLPGQRIDVIIDVFIFHVPVHVYGDDVETSS